MRTLLSSRVGSGGGPALISHYLEPRWSGLLWGWWWMGRMCFGLVPSYSSSNSITQRPLRCFVGRATCSALTAGWRNERTKAMHTDTQHCGTDSEHQDEQCHNIAFI